MLSAMQDDDDKQLFRDRVGAVTPVKGEASALRRVPAITPGLQQRRRAATRADQGRGNPLAGIEHIARIKPLDPLCFRRDGVQHGVFKNLRQGRYAPETRIDLHGMSVAQARDAVQDFVRDALAHHIRCGLIAHGKGEYRDEPALLKSCVNHWLRELEEVLAFHSAQRHHGGLGATYVLLRKSARQRAENREKFGGRGEQS
ncbi:MAG: DNA endonuclease SmrA [Porticoccaceae bacterium]